MEMLIATEGKEIIAVSATDLRWDMVTWMGNSYDLLSFRFGCRFPMSAYCGKNICGRLLTVIRSRELMSRAMVIPFMIHPFIRTMQFDENTEDTPCNTFYKFLSTVHSINDHFTASLVPVLPLSDSTNDLALNHSHCFEKHGSSNLPIATEASPTHAGYCIYCKLWFPLFSFVR